MIEDVFGFVCMSHTLWRVMNLNFRDKEDLQKFLSDTPYYASLDNYCLGNTMAEAGEVVRKIADDKKLKESSFCNEAK